MTARNMIIDMDELEHFKSKVNYIKEKEPVLLQKTM